MSATADLPHRTRRRPLRYRYPSASAVLVSLLPATLSTWVGLTMLGYAWSHWAGRAADRLSAPVPVDHLAAAAYAVAGLALFIVPAIAIDIIGVRHGARRGMTGFAYLVLWLIVSMGYLLMAQQMT